MWYFAWVLGLPLAAAFAVLNAMWFELMDDAEKARAGSSTPPTVIPAKAGTHGTFDQLQH